MPGICAQCRTVIVAGGVTRNGKKYCCEGCASQGEGRVPGFCPDCIAETVNEQPGGLARLNGIGTTIKKTFGSSPCPQCGSVQARVWFTVFFIALIPLRRYRMIKLAGRRFLARRIKPA